MARPVTLFTGQWADLTLDTLAAKAKSQGVNVALSVVPGMQHVFPALSGRAPEADQELARIAAWYRAL